MKHLLLFAFICLIISLGSCKKDKEITKPFELHTHSLTLKLGDTATISIIQNLDSSLVYSKIWKISDNNIINEYDKTHNSFSVTAENEGRSTVYLSIPELNLIDSCVVIVGSSNLVRVLAIGNSFSEDAIESHLFEIANARNRQILIGNLVIGGSSLSDHLTNQINNQSNYSYRKIEIDGNKSTKANVTINEALNDEYWDYISFQQVSYNGGIIATFEESLPELYKLITSNNPYAKTKYLLHQTWAYSPYTNHQGFLLYEKDQIKMYNALTSTYEKARKLVPIYKVVPSGTAIQNARGTSLGNDLTRDGYHLSFDKGRYIVACTWFETLFRIKVNGNTYSPDNINEEEKAICQWAAHAAQIQPLKLTEK